MSHIQSLVPSDFIRTQRVRTVTIRYLSNISDRSEIYIFFFLLQIDREVSVLLTNPEPASQNIINIITIMLQMVVALIFDVEM